MSKDKGKEDKHPYHDIINLDRHVSPSRNHMPIIDRAAKFSPFAAITGFEQKIKETARITDRRLELDESEKVMLDKKLKIIEEDLSKKQEVEIVFFKPDEKKTGGAYSSIKGLVKKVDKNERVVVMDDQTSIDIKEIIDIKGQMFAVVDDYIY